MDPESKALLRVLHLSVQTGRAVLLERLQTQIDPSLEQLITKNVLAVNGSDFIRIGEARRCTLQGGRKARAAYDMNSWRRACPSTAGDQLVPYNSSFSLWMTTKLGNPQFPPEIEADVTLINFVIMQDGLAEQLLVGLIAIIPC